MTLKLKNWTVRMMLMSKLKKMWTMTMTMTTTTTKMTTRMKLARMMKMILTKRRIWGPSTLFSLWLVLKMKKRLVTLNQTRMGRKTNLKMMRTTRMTMRMLTILERLSLQQRGRDQTRKLPMMVERMMRGHPRDRGVLSQRMTTEHRSISLYPPLSRTL